MVSTLILLLVFTAASVTTLVILMPSPESRLVKERVGVIRRAGLTQLEDGSLVDEEMAQPFVKRVIGPLVERFFRAVVHLTPGRVQESIRVKLAQAGSPMSASQFLGIQTMAAGGATLLGLVLTAPLLAKKPMGGIVLIVTMGVLGWRLPVFGLGRKATQRRQLIDRALPDVLDLLSVSVEAGLGLDGAIQKVGEKFPEPTAGEFRELLKEIRLGSSRADALRRLSDRTGLPDMRTFTAAVIQAEQLGVAISRVLRGQSEALRVKRKQRVEERAMALPLKMLFPLLIFIFPTIFIVVLGPVLIQLFTQVLK